MPGRLNKKAYRERNRIERLLGKLKEFRRVVNPLRKTEADVSRDNSSRPWIHPPETTFDRQQSLMSLLAALLESIAGVFVADDRAAARWLTVRCGLLPVLLVGGFTLYWWMK